MGKSIGVWQKIKKSKYSKHHHKEDRKCSMILTQSYELLPPTSSKSLPPSYEKSIERPQQQERKVVYSVTGERPFC